MSITYRAPAKIMISGEHAVVYGKPSLLSAIKLHATVTVEEDKTTTVPHDACFLVEEAVVAYLKKEKIASVKKPYRVTADSAIPLGQGLGSSAALSVALSAGLFELFSGKKPTSNQINTMAYTAEQSFHGTPSGADNSASSYGGLIFYRKEFEFLKTLSRLHAKLPKPIEERLYLIDSGIPEETTKTMVQQVARRYNQDSDQMDGLLHAIEKVTKRFVVAIVKEDQTFFRDCIIKNQHLLEQIGVVSDQTRHLLQSLASFGVGKITGAGGAKQGSGFLLFLADNPEQLEQYLTDRGINWHRCQQDYRGVTRLDQPKPYGIK